MFGLYETAFGALTWGNILMLLLGGLLIYLGITKKMEPVLLVPIGFGIIMVNVPLGGLMVFDAEGFPIEAGTISETVKAIADGELGVLNILYTYALKI